MGGGGLDGVRTRGTAASSLGLERCRLGDLVTSQARMVSVWSSVARFPAQLLIKPQDALVASDGGYALLESKPSGF